MQTTINKEIEVDMAHRLINHEGLCRNIHGHRYKFRAYVTGAKVTEQGDSSEGMIIDFTELKRALKEVIEDTLDHTLLVSEDDDFMPQYKELADGGMNIQFVPYISTVENIGMDYFQRLEQHLSRYCIELKELHCWETPTSCAIITKGDVLP